jgi:hypothetical protein
MRLQNYLTELFDTKVKIDYHENSLDKFVSSFSVDDKKFGVTIQIQYDVGTKDDWQILFFRYDSDNPLSLLGDLTPKQTLAVFSAVKQSVLKWHNARKPKMFFFTAKSTEKSRVKIYGQFAKAMAKLLDFKMISGTTKGDMKFVFTKKQSIKDKYKV